TILGSAKAYAEDSSLDAGGNISVAADSTSDIDAEILAVAGSAAFGGVGVAASIGIGIARNNIGYVTNGADIIPSYDPLEVMAYLDNTSVETYGELSLDASSSETVDA